MGLYILMNKRLVACSYDSVAHTHLLLFPIHYQYHRGNSFELPGRRHSPQRLQVSTAGEGECPSKGGGALDHEQGQW